MDLGTILDAFVLAMAVASALLLLYGLALVIAGALEGDRKADPEAPKEAPTTGCRPLILD